MKLLVVYYSLEGNTRLAAEQIAGKLGADLCPLEPLKAMPEKRSMQMLVGGFQASFGKGGALKPLEVDMTAYDGLILGTPVWAGKPAAPVQRFLRENSPEVKLLGVFTCSGGGDNGGCLRFLEKKGWRAPVTAALADRKNPVSSGNDGEIARFISEIQEKIGS